MNKILKDAFILLAITLVAGIFLGLVYKITMDPIAVQQAKAKEEACKNVFADAAEFTAYTFDQKAVAEALNKEGLTQVVIDDVMEAKDASGAPVGFVFTVTDKEGYNGNIQFTMGVKNDGTLNGISFLSIGETPGLGMRATTPEFMGQFAGKKAEKLKYTKSGASADDEIEALSGATITTNAMTNGVNGGLAAFRCLEGGAS